MARVYGSAEQAIYEELVAIRKLLAAILEQLKNANVL